MTFSLLARDGNADVTLLQGMTNEQILTALNLAGLTLVNGYLTMKSTARPMVVLGMTADIPILGPLLGLQSPEQCISGNTFSYPINGLTFPLPYGADAVVPMLQITMGESNLLVNMTPNSWNINNRYTINQTITSITATILSIYGYALQSSSSATLILKLN